jgi:hypothetical protein
MNEHYKSGYVARCAGRKYLEFANRYDPDTQPGEVGAWSNGWMDADDDIFFERDRPL